MRLLTTEIIIRAIHLYDAALNELAIACVGSETIEPHVRHIQAWLAIDDPFGDDASHTAGTGNAVRTKAAGGPKATQVSGRSEQEFAVGCERLKTIRAPHDPRRFECWHTRRRGTPQ